MVGTTLGHYRIDREIGSGGMGVVYAAEDLTLHRQVAVKVVAMPLSTDAEFRHRFEREAQAIAALNHPNIVTIHSVEQAGDVHFLTMELVEGKPLSQVIPHGGLPLDRLLKLAVPLADAISAAHQRGITHRDLKPANVMVTDDGRLKVLDFGLAKLREGMEPSSGTTLGAPTITGEGRILGTVAYMSPEQAEGRPIDHRSDIFSLGIVLYEMAAGERPFKGGTSVSIISSIIKDTPRPLTEVHASIPRDLVRIVRRCLMKDPEQRYQSAKDIRNDLQELAQALESGEIAAPAGVAAPAANRRSLAWMAVGAAALIAVAIAAVKFWPRAEPAVGRPVEAAFTQLTVRQGVEQSPSLSPDGKWVVYSGDAAGNSDIYLQSVSGQNPINLTKDAPDNDLQPVFSPDGERIAFRSNRSGGGIFVMGRTGESVRRVTDGGYNPAWSPTGKEIVFGTENVVTSPGSRGLRGALWIVDVDSGQKRQLTAAADDAVQPSWSPQGHRIAYWSARGAQRQRDVVTIAAAGGEPVLVTDDAALDWNPVWSPDGRFLYFSSERGGSMNLWRVPIDERSGRVRGSAEAITAPSRFAGHLSISADGRRVAYASIDVERNVQRVAFDPASEKIAGDPQWVTRGSKLWAYMQASPDGQWIALSSGSPQEDIFVAHADGSGLRQITNDAAFDRVPRWSPDGKQLAFYSNRSGSWDAWRINVDGSGLTALTKQSGAHTPVWSPDGSRMAFYELGDNVRVTLFDPRVPWENQKLERVSYADGGWRPYAWSADGRLLAGCRGIGASAAGILVYSLEARSFTLLTDTGCEPQWLDDNRLIFTRSPGTLAVVDRQSRRVRDVLSRPGEDVVLQTATRDGRQLFVIRSSKEADIWMATIK